MKLISFHFLILENVEKYNKHIDIIKKLDGQRETILQANNDGKLMNEETKSEYEELKRKKNDIIKKCVQVLEIWPFLVKYEFERP